MTFRKICVFRRPVIHFGIDVRCVVAAPGRLHQIVPNALKLARPHCEPGLGNGGHITGYAYATKWKARSAYRFAVETTVYLADGLARQGLGSRLYEELFGLLKERQIHAAIGGIALPNDASVALHEKFGMRKVAHFEQVGFKFGKWVDVGYWERFL